MATEILDFIKYYSNGFSINESTELELNKHLEIVSFPKQHVLFQENTKHDYAYYVLQGAARSFYLKDGTEVNTWFAFEQDIIGSLRVYNGETSRETIQLVEDSRLIAINLRTLKPLIYSNLQVSNFISSIIEEYAQFLEDRLFYSQFVSSKDRYELLLKHEPLTLQRIPLTYIASYLGISRETLSRLRAK